MIQCIDKVELWEEMDRIIELGLDTQAKQDYTNGRVREIINQFNKEASSEMNKKGYNATLKCENEDDEIKKFAKEI